MKIKEKDKISIIIPVYNAEKNIKKCIDSVVIQTYSNIEIIIINDGSNDNSERIIKEYKKNDKRIKYIYQDNCGVSCARNKGLENATGDFICFVDSDDFVEKNYIEVLLNNIKKYDVDIVKCNFYQNELIKNGQNNDKIYNLQKNEEKIDIYRIFYTTYKFNSVWGELINKRCIKNIRFDENLKMAEDFKFNWEIVKNVKKIMLIKDSLYHYEINNSGINYNISLEKVNIKYENIINLYNEIIEKDKENETLIIEKFLKEIIPHIIEISKYKNFKNKIERVILL